MGAGDDQSAKEMFVVLVNSEEQYSFWPKGHEVPKGWRAVKEGTKEECGQYVREVWTDMRPLSLRKKMEEFERQKRAAADTEVTNGS